MYLVNREMTLVNLGKSNTILNYIKISRFTGDYTTYKIPYAMEEEIDKKISDLLKDGIIRQCSSPWNSPLIPIWKKSGDLRLCVEL